MTRTGHLSPKQRANLICVGFWSGGRPAVAAEESLPDAHDAVDPDWRTEAPAERQAVIDHVLEAGTVVASYMGMSLCRVCGKHNGSREHSDGTYLWPSGLIHYLTAHDVRLPRDFIDHVLATRDTVATT